MGVRYLETAIADHADYFFETTLGVRTIAALLEEALDRGLEVSVWYVGLATPEAHLARVAARVRAGGHDIPEADVRRRFDDSRRNLVRLLPRLTELKVYDNSEEADPARGLFPEPRLLLHWREGSVLGPDALEATPGWEADRGPGVMHASGVGSDAS